jgi:hypothetical protein
MKIDILNEVGNERAYVNSISGISGDCLGSTSNGLVEWKPGIYSISKVFTCRPDLGTNPEEIIEPPFGVKYILISAHISVGINSEGEICTGYGTSPCLVYGAFPDYPIAYCVSDGGNQSLALSSKGTNTFSIVENGGIGIGSEEGISLTTLSRSDDPAAPSDKPNEIEVRITLRILPNIIISP